MDILRMFYSNGKILLHLTLSKMLWNLGPHIKPLSSKQMKLFVVDFDVKV
jgi:hypothetical protein